MPGRKSRAEQVEEMYCLLAANMLLEAFGSQPVAALTPSDLDQVIDDINAKVHGSAKITSWKRRICLHLPAKVYGMLCEHYLKYTWERSFLSEELLHDSLWRRDAKLPNSEGEWQATYTMTEEVLDEVGSCLVRWWERQWPWETAKNAPLRDLQSARPIRLEDNASCSIGFFRKSRQSSAKTG